MVVRRRRRRVFFRITGVSFSKQEVEMKFLVLAAGLLLTTGSALAQKIYIDYDPSYDASGVETFAWAETSGTSVADTNPLLHSRIVNGIEYYLTLSGAHADERAPDVRVTYHTSSKKEIVVDTSHYGYGYPSRWGYYGRPYPSAAYGSTTSTVRTYDKGTLVVDIWDAASDKLVWRGTAVNITVTDDPTKMGKRIDKALKKMVDKWHKIKGETAQGG
jgi:hypothetical protein